MAATPLTLAGGCICGKLRYEVRDPQVVLACPDIINVRPGTLDDPSVAQIWTSLAQPWAVAEGVR